MKRSTFLLQGWVAWAMALLVVWALPGSRWKAAAAPEFPWAILLPTLGLLVALIVASLVLAWIFGPSGARSRALALVMAPPEFIWGGVVLMLWPGRWGPPGLFAWVTAFLAAAVPGEVRWLTQALPAEDPLPSAYGRRAVKLARRKALVHLMSRWVAVRLPLWITATLVLERMFGVAGLGSDWMDRIAVRDRTGIALWVIFLTSLWTLAQWRKRSQT